MYSANVGRSSLVTRDRIPSPRLSALLRASGRAASRPAPGLLTLTHWVSVRLTVPPGLTSVLDPSLPLLALLCRCHCRNIVANMTCALKISIVRQSLVYPSIQFSWLSNCPAISSQHCANREEVPKPPLRSLWRLIGDFRTQELALERQTQLWDLSKFEPIGTRQEEIAKKFCRF